VASCDPGPARAGRASPKKAEAGASAGPRRAERVALTVVEVADLLGTTERFPRRLIAERRIRFVRVGRHVRIPVSAVREFISAGLVESVNHGKRGRAA